MEMRRLQNLVDDLYAAFGTPSTLVDSRKRLVAFSEQPLERVDELRRESLLVRRQDYRPGETGAIKITDAVLGNRGLQRILPGPDETWLPRTCVPLTSGGIVVAHLFMIDPDGLVTEAALEPFRDDLDAAARAIEMQNLPETTGSIAVRLLVSGGAYDRRVAIEELRHFLRNQFESGCRVVVVDTSGAEDRSAQFWARALGRNVPWSAVDQHMVYLLPADVALRDRLHRAGITTEQQGTVETPVLVGIGDVVEQWVDARTSYLTALKALRIARSGALDSPVVDSADMGPWRVLLALDEEEALQLIEPRVKTLITEQDTQMCWILHMYLERKLDVDQIAQRLHMHRTTLYAKLRKVQDQYGLSWDDADDRLSTTIGLRVALLRSGIRGWSSDAARTAIRNVS